MADLDQSLDAILAAKPRPARKPKTSAPKAANGVKKASAKPAQKSNAAAKLAPKPLNKAPESSKIIVHGLPTDVTERQIKEYMTTEVGPVARCELAYNAQGKSKGQVMILFRKDGGQNYAQKACALLNGRSVDSTGPKPLKMRVEIVTEIAQPGLADRLGGLPKNVVQAIARSGGKKSGAIPVTGKGGKNDIKGKKLKKTGPGRVKKVPKTAEELDAEMTDYFEKKTA